MKNKKKNNALQNLIEDFSIEDKKNIVKKGIEVLPLPDNEQLEIMSDYIAKIFIKNFKGGKK